MTDVDQPDAVVISVVYDGPPRAGKTTSVRAPARSFGREVFTPEERDGRTVHFDCLEHVGGRFDGAPIHCQVVSVPGQKRWRRRRAHFLERADVVIVHRQPALRELAAVAPARAERMVAEVGAVCAGIRLPLRCTLDTIGADADRAVYVDLMLPVERRVERA